MRRYKVYAEPARDLQEYLDHRIEGEVIFIERQRNGDWLVIAKIPKAVAMRDALAAWRKRLGERAAYWWLYWTTRLVAAPNGLRAWLKERL